MRLLFLSTLLLGWVACADREIPTAPREPAAKINPGLTASANRVASAPDGRYAWLLDGHRITVPAPADTVAGLDALYGTWFVDISEEAGFPGNITFTFAADSALRVQYYFDFSEINFWELALEELYDFDEFEFPVLEILQAHGAGAYRVEGDVIYPHVEHTSILINGADPFDYFLEIAIALANLVAEQEGIPPEEREKYEEEFIGQFLADYAAEFEEETFFIELNEEEFTFAVVGDVLTMTDSYGDTLVYDRVIEPWRNESASKPVVAAESASKKIQESPPSAAGAKFIYER